MLILLTILVILLLIRQLATVAMIWKANGIEVIPHFIVLVLLILFASCSKDSLSETCSGGCDARMELPGYLDGNGYYHIDLDFTGEYLPRFNIDVFATPIVPEYQYNEVSVVSAEFDSDTFWKLGENLIYRVSYYNPFNSEYTSSTVVPSRVEELTLNLFTGQEVNVVQNTEIYFRENKPSAELFTKRIVGPFPPQIVGDTITIYAEIYWEAGNYSKFQYLEEKFIIE